MNDAMLDVAPQEGVWGPAMALDADRLTFHYVKKRTWKPNSPFAPRVAGLLV
jgi:hypothetical protein